MKNNNESKIYVVVTTLHRGVFFGKLDKYNEEKKWIKLEDARMAVYWSSDIRGVLGLASCGPSKNCKISFAVPKLTLTDVTAVIMASKEAVDAWEKQPWH